MFAFLVSEDSILADGIERYLKIKSAPLKAITCDHLLEHIAPPMVDERATNQLSTMQQGVVLRMKLTIHEKLASARLAQEREQGDLQCWHHE